MSESDVESDEPVSLARPHAYLKYAPKGLDKALYWDVHPAEGKVQSLAYASMHISDHMFHVAVVDRLKWHSQPRDNSALRQAGMVFEPTLLKIICTICRTVVPNVKRHFERARLRHDLTELAAGKITKAINACCLPSPSLYLPVFDQNCPIPPYKNLEVLEGTLCRRCGFVCDKALMAYHGVHGKGGRRSMPGWHHKIDVGSSGKPYVGFAIPDPPHDPIDTAPIPSPQAPPILGEPSRKKRSQVAIPQSSSTAIFPVSSESAPLPPLVANSIPSADVVAMVARISTLEASGKAQRKAAKSADIERTALVARISSLEAAALDREARITSIEASSLSQASLIQTMSNTQCEMQDLLKVMRAERAQEVTVVQGIGTGTKSARDMQTAAIATIDEGRVMQGLLSERPTAPAVLLGSADSEELNVEEEYQSESDRDLDQLTPEPQEARQTPSQKRRRDEY